MKFYSTRNPGKAFTLRDAVLKGLPDDGGLFMPETIPSLPADFIARLPQVRFPEIGTEIARVFLSGEVEENDIRRITEDAITFDAPLTRLDEDTYALELFHGPTLAFKDFGARFMARLMANFIGHDSRRLTILVATSGDTGSAVAHGFHGVEGIDVVILYPSGMVSPLQEKQLTTLGKNIQALEISGTFDDCQRMVKAAFLDRDLSSARQLTSANSINIARLIPQSFYYFRAVAQCPGQPVVFSVPSGNFGNLTAGLFAQQMGLPVQHFVAATNSNRVFPEYLSSGLFQPKPSVNTISNAMDVGHPSNFERMKHLYHDSVEEMKSAITGYSVSDEETRDEMRRQYELNGYILDPHGAVGAVGLTRYRKSLPTPKGGETSRFPGILLETAHPAKFIDTVEETLKLKLELPRELSEVAARQKQSLKMENSVEKLKEFLLSGE